MSTPTDVNHRYFLEYASERADGRPLTILDYGCGNGELVGALRERHIDCYGVDIFYPGGTFDSPELQDLVGRGTVRAFAESGRIPFEDGTFDLVMSNQVFEHVEHLEPVVGELARVLKPDGVMLHHFPSREVIREGHIGIPLAHRLPNGGLRLGYVALLRGLGLGYFKGDEGILNWTRAKTDWLDRYCYYRPYSEIAGAFGREFEIEHREIEYCRFRARGRRVLPWLLNRKMLSGVGERVFRRLAFMALEMRKRGG